MFDFDAFGIPSGQNVIVKKAEYINKKDENLVDFGPIKKEEEKKNNLVNNFEDILKLSSKENAQKQ